MRIVSASAALLFLLIGLSGPAWAQQVTVAALIEALKPENTGPVVRSIARREGGLRGIAIEGPLPAELDLPQIDLTVNFEYDSARLTTDAMLVLRALGLALNHPGLAGARFQVAGHTSAEGTDDYNLSLSDRRARAVADHLLAFYEIGPERLVPVGYGETQLLYPELPESELNRRVTIINLAPLTN